MKAVLGIVGLLGLLGAAIGADPSTPEYLYRKALELEKGKADFKGAMPIYETIVTEYEENAEFAALALYRLGGCYEKTGELEKASECARKLVGQYAAAASNNAELAAWTKRYAKPEEAAAKREKMIKKLNAIVIPNPA
jgi:tetratricopeptide (TPR) repeat protein